MASIEAHGLIWKDEEYGWSASAKVGDLSVMVHAVTVLPSGHVVDCDYDEIRSIATELLNYRGSRVPLVQIDGKPHVLIAVS